MATAQKFIWYELMTEDVAASQAFYEKVVGWTGKPFGDGNGPSPYVVLNIGEAGVAGIMEKPAEAKARGVPTMWIGYIYSPDTDRAIEKLEAGGGKVHREPADIPGVGRFAVVSDPQHGTFQLMTPTGEGGEQPPPMTPGRVGWRELYTTDLAGAVKFYSEQFGWRKGEGMDMGPMGTYQLMASDGGDDDVGMMTKPPHIPHPFWQFYFNVDGIDAGASRVTDNGGKILFGPMEVPGGGWSAQCMDPQGAVFGLFAQGR